jgi:hypothetical protein
MQGWLRHLGKADPSRASKGFPKRAIQGCGQHCCNLPGYLHRYDESTLARMRTEYVVPLQGRMAARIDQIEADKVTAASTSLRKKLQKEQDDLKRQKEELKSFEERLRHLADQRIVLDLDDGAKANYAKFGDLLAESRAIVGAEDDE